MRIDLYTKTVLTVIALCLLFLTADRFIHPSTTYAQAQYQRVILAGVEYESSGGNRKTLPFAVSAESQTNAVVPTTQ